MADAKKIGSPSEARERDALAREIALSKPGDGVAGAATVAGGNAERDDRGGAAIVHPILEVAPLEGVPGVAARRGERGLRRQPKRHDPSWPDRLRVDLDPAPDAAPIRLAQHRGIEGLPRLEPQGDR